MNRGEELRLKVALRDTRTAGQKVVDACRAGDGAALPGLLAGMAPAERRACLPELKDLRKRVRQEWTPESARIREALRVAGAGCHTAPTAAAAWIGSGQLAAWGTRDRSALVEVIEQQPAAWQATVVARLAARGAAAWGWDDYPVIEYLVRSTGCPVPTSDAFVDGWLRDRTWGADGSRRRGSLLAVLRGDDLLPALLPRLFELADVAGSLAPAPNRKPEDTWPGALAELARAGELDRAELIGPCVARLVRGGRPNDQRAFLAVLEALAPTAEENARHARDHMAMLDGLSTVAARAQQVLAGLDDSGLLASDLLAEASDVVLFRTEKKLVRAQLGWLDRAARRDPARAGSVVLATAAAFGHPDTALQERALNVVARHLPAAGPAVLPDLRLAAEALNPVHHGRAAELLGLALPAPADTPADLLPPAPEPQPLAGPLATPAEVAEELSAVLAGGADVAAFERALDGLVRHAHQDREALVEALQPVLRVHQWQGGRRWVDCGPSDVLYVASAVAGLLPPQRLWGALHGPDRSPLRGHANNTVFGRWFAARLEEAAWQVTATRPPLLLAVPSVATGALDAAELVARVAAYEAAGARPGEVDLSCALLRVTPTGDAGVLAAAARLTSPAGRRVAAWLRAGGLPAQPSERVRFAPGRGGKPEHRYQERWWEGLVRYEVAQPGPQVPEGPGGEGLAEECLDLLAATEPGVQRARSQTEWNWNPTPHWLAALPNHREELAARLLVGFAGAADRDERGAPQLLPYLAEADGPAGPAMHLALAYGLAARHEEDRAAAVDALLVLAARGDLDGGLLGGELAALAGVGALKVSRLAPALAGAAATGAYGTVWSVLAGALPGLLAGEAPRGSGELLGVAADCARRSGARGAVAEVTALAARGGSSRLVREARALREALGEA
ncbi:DUF6493 family protein [Kitasatospora sp. NBC_00240]|uniref:DUF7825 domain-containing protein n=1 Tax=Kitasatospora sp. NBC_00240 TaxID=2903567 RepID=UPI002254106E|nr:DUF6493 family protein [Kitasatospora sp. NBC_00240]MCX5209495.1 DUF6493 family protein [Kitasatospora sp. NBC_00240]